MQKEVKQTWYFHKTPQEVWEYLTNPELLEQWLMKTDFKPILGHKFCFISTSGCEHYCEVLEINPFTKLSYSWQKKSDKDGKPFNSTVVWTLVPKENGTELHLIHHGFIALEDYTSHNNGWTFLGNRLGEFLSTVKKNQNDIRN
ncbi:MAG TPA: SRPBCC domain-containing protein [Cytophagaceae bacterium]|jgi:uncharacterized protein YndB with AHSA1/START domain|nr:SRPBCC domain-containing protein [Cytophagaceae bacterium]